MENSIKISSQFKNLSQQKEEKQMKTNDPNMIVEPTQYLDPEKKTFDIISSNIMQEHIAFEEIAQNKEKMRQKRYIFCKTWPMKLFI